MHVNVAYDSADVARLKSMLDPFSKGAAEQGRVGLSPSFVIVRG